MTMPAASAVDEGIRCLQQGDAVRAVALLGNAVQSDPNDGRAFQYLGIARVQQGDMTGGIHALREAARLLPTNSGISYNLGIALNKAGQTDEARRVLEKTLTLDPGNARARAALDSLITATHNAPTAPPPLSTSGTLASIGMSGLGGIGGGSTAPMAEAAPAAAPPPPPPPPTGTMFTPPPAMGMGAPPSPALGGTQFGAGAMNRAGQYSREPTSSERILRGLGWGALCGQWWTLWESVFGIIIPGHQNGAIMVVAILVLAIWFGFVGAIMGMIIGAVNAEDNVGAGIGIGIGLLMFGAEFLLIGFSSVIFRVIWWALSGRRIGRWVTARTQLRIET